MMPEDDDPMANLLEALLREAAHRRRDAQQDKAALVREVLARARGPEAWLQAWWRAHHGGPPCPTVVFDPAPDAAGERPCAAPPREVVGAHLRAYLTTTAAGATHLQVVAADPRWAGACLLCCGQPHEVSVLHQGLLLVGTPSASGGWTGGCTRGLLTDAAALVVAEPPLDVALLRTLPVATVQASIAWADDHRRWRTWYRQQAQHLTPALRLALAVALAQR